MKKLSLLIAMILCITIGGVYAAWTYTNPAADITDKHLENIAIHLPSAEQSGAAGEYTITTNVTHISIDQLGTNTAGKDFHTAVLNYTVNDNLAPWIKITLKLKENTGSDIFDNIHNYYYVKVEDVASQYGGKDIFIDKKPEDKTEILKADWSYDAETDTYWYMINIADEIALNEFVLGSKPEHTAFAAALGRPVFVAYVSDGTVPVAQTE